MSKSKEMIKEQSQNFIATHSKSVIIIALLSIFIPLFFTGIKDTNCYILWFSTIPSLLMILAVVFMLLVIWPKTMQTGFNIAKLETLKNEQSKKILELEVGANFTAIETNDEISKTQQKLFKIGLIFTLLSIVIAIIILLINTICNS